MRTSSIDTDNNITAPADANRDTFTSVNELAKLTAEWPASRFVEIRNSFAGVTPFDVFKPVKKFTNRQTAVTRIWDAIQMLGAEGEVAAPEAVEPSVAKKERKVAKPAKSPKKIHSDEQAGIRLVNIKSGEVVFAYAVNKKNSLHGRQTAAEACAKHLKEIVSQ